MVTYIRLNYIYLRSRKTPYLTLDDSLFNAPYLTHDVLGILLRSRRGGVLIEQNHQQSIKDNLIPLCRSRVVAQDTM